MLKVILTLIVINISMYANSCWSSVELSEFALDEFDTTTFSVKDAIKCEVCP